MCVCVCTRQLLFLFFLRDNRSRRRRLCYEWDAMSLYIYTMYNCYKLWTARYWYRYIITSFVRRLQTRSVEWQRRRRRWWWAVSESLGVLSVEKSNACIRESCARNLFYLHVFFFYLLLSFFFSSFKVYLYIYVCVYVCVCVYIILRDDTYVFYPVP